MLTIPTAAETVTLYLETPDGHRSSIASYGRTAGRYGAGAFPALAILEAARRHLTEHPSDTLSLTWRDAEGQPVTSTAPIERI